MIHGVMQFHPPQLSICSFHINCPWGPVDLPFHPLQNSWFLSVVPQSLSQNICKRHYINFSKGNTSKIKQYCFSSVIKELRCVLKIQKGKKGI